jgi:hypothetical protein
VTALSFGPRLLPTAMVILFIWKNGDRPILTVLGQEFHWEFASLRKTQVGDAQRNHLLSEFARRIRMAIKMDFRRNS